MAYVRIASFEGGDDDRLAEMNRESGAPDLPDGCSGAMVFSTGAGRRLFVTWFETREAVDAAEEAFDRMGDSIPEDVRGNRTDVTVYEVVWNSWEQ